MGILETLFFFILGTIIGSFLNVLVLRLHTGLTLSGRSHCFSCSKTLSVSELIPLLSFLWGRGRCRSCGTRISFQYPLVELGTGLSFLFLAAALSPFQAINFVSYAVVFSLLIAIAVYDLRHGIIPNRFVYPLLLVASLVSFFDLSRGHIFPNAGFFEGVLAALLFFSCFAGLWFFSGGKLLGLGDGKLVSVFGLLLGFSYGLSAIVIAFWMGAFYGVFMLCAQKNFFPRSLSMLNSNHRRITMKSEVPFAPFLIAGFYIVFFTGLNLFLF